MGPIATGLGEIYHFEVRAKPGYTHRLMDLRTMLEWQIAPQLRSVAGVIEVNTQGGELKTYEVQIDPNKLHNFDISLTQVFEALRQNNANEGGGYIVHGTDEFADLTGFFLEIPTIEGVDEQGQAQGELELRFRMQAVSP